MCVGETSSLLERAHLAPDISLRVETLFASVVAGRRHGVENLPCRSIRQYSVDLERGCGWVGRLLESGGIILVLRPKTPKTRELLQLRREPREGLVTRFTLSSSRYGISSARWREG